MKASATEVLGFRGAWGPVSADKIIAVNKDASVEPAP